MSRIGWAVLALGIMSWLSPATVCAQSIPWLDVSLDVTLEAAGELTGPADLTSAAPPLVVAHPALDLPAHTDLLGVHRISSSEYILAVDQPIALEDMDVLETRDLARWCRGVLTLEVAGSQVGIPPGVGIDAVSMNGPQYLVSFDQAVEVSGDLAFDEDIVVIKNGLMSLYWDGSAAGVAEDLDLDAIHQTDSGELILSFDQSGSLDGVVFDDEDLLLYSSVSGFSLYSDLSTMASSLPGIEVADLDAVGQIVGSLFLDAFEGSDTSTWSRAIP